MLFLAALAAFLSKRPPRVVAGTSPPVVPASPPFVRAAIGGQPIGELHGGTGERTVVMIAAKASTRLLPCRSLGLLTLPSCAVAGASRGIAETLAFSPTAISASERGVIPRAVAVGASWFPRRTRLAPNAIAPRGSIWRHNKKHYMAGATAVAAAAPEPSPEQSASAVVEQQPPVVDKVKVALCQLRVTADKEANIAHAHECIDRAAAAGAQLVVLPVSSDAQQWRSRVICSIPEKGDGKLYNTSCVYGSNGELLGKHRKVHLFDIYIPGKITFIESDVLAAGDRLTTVDTEFGRIGVGICFDIRFPEMAMLYAARGARLICYPGAFNMTTGPLHWELLQRARAADNQVFVVTCSPARDPNGSYVCWGHSSVIGPFGEVLATTEHEEDTVFAELDFTEIPLRRTYVPLKKRHDVYRLMDLKYT
ncbi:hypothetical protein CBR_g17055 [Chara braunii]|uniref:CN hydrolase domain-containing protein n=1 Tax=Chara braunii TaxID=69332 RepID=A0A388KUH0_CHABU|nr:hypothetical protein CBR_g17055 [Chara braunii]|eukprot:GBG73714.1 hypothetical protein CBR_g17055 [Chara braunii]